VREKRNPLADVASRSKLGNVIALGGWWQKRFACRDGSACRPLIAGFPPYAGVRSGGYVQKLIAVLAAPAGATYAAFQGRVLASLPCLAATLPAPAYGVRNRVEPHAVRSVAALPLRA
jgi:hypothetical protein